MKVGVNPVTKPVLQTAIITAGPAILAAWGGSLAQGSPELFAVQFTAGMLAGMAGFATNLLAAEADKIGTELPLDATAVGINHHLAQLAGQALATIVGEEGLRHAEGSPERMTLEAAAKRTVRAWHLVLEIQSGEDFRRLDSARLTDVVAGQAVLQDGVLVLEAKSWLPFATFLLTGPNGNAAAPEMIARHLSERFEKDFGRHFLEHAKASAEKDPSAFAALLIQFLGELRLTQREHSAGFKDLAEKLALLTESVEGACGTVAQKPGFDWQKLTTHLAEATHAHDEARAFYLKNDKNWEEFLRLAADTWALVRQLHGTHHEQLLHRIADLNLLVRDQVVAVLKELRRGERDPLSGAELIMHFVHNQRQLDEEARRQFHSFLQQRDGIQGRGGHHYLQPERWTPGYRTRMLWREAGRVFVPRPPLHGPDDVPPPGTNYYLHGESGHGKSILAANIADRLIKQGYCALTFNLRQAGDILQHLALLTDKEWLGLELPEEAVKGSSSKNARIVAACTWLLERAVGNDDKHPPFCLVWDNADDLVTLDHLFRLQLLRHRGVQIITTRIPPTAFKFGPEHPCQDWPPMLLKIHEVGPYSDAEARDCLEQELANGIGKAPPKVSISAKKRILQAARMDGERSGIDPLRLHDLVSALRERGWRLDEVLGPDAPKPPRGAKKPPLVERSHQEVLAGILEGLSPLTRTVWKLLVHLAPAPIPEEFWSRMERVFRDPEALSAEERKRIEPELKDRLPVVQARSALAQAGLLTGDEDGDLVHARHHAIGRELTPPKERAGAYRLVVRLLYAAAPSADPHEDPSVWPFYKTVDQHLLASFTADRIPAIVPLRETGWLTNRFNKYLLQQSRRVEALAIARLNLEYNLSQAGEASENYAISIHELARAQLSQGRFSEAEEGLLAALEIRRQHHGDSHPSVATTLHVLARCRLAQGRLAEAEEGLLTTLEIRRQHHGDCHPSIATTRHVLARCRFEQGRFSEAEEGFLAALEIHRQHRGTSHPFIATTLHGLAHCRLEQGHLAEAEEGFLDSLRIDREYRGEGSGEAASSRLGLARVLRAAGKMEDAEQLFARAHAEMESALGWDHPRVGTLMHHWARGEMGDIPSDRPAPTEVIASRVEKALEIRRKRLPADHHALAATRLLRVECLRRRGKAEEARSEAESAAAVLARTLPTEHRLNSEARALLAVLDGK